MRICTNNINTTANSGDISNTATSGSITNEALSVSNTATSGSITNTVTSGNIEACVAMIQDLLTIRADRDKYYYGVDQVFGRHGDIIRRFCEDAPELIQVFSIPPKKNLARYPSLVIAPHAQDMPAPLVYAC